MKLAIHRVGARYANRIASGCISRRRMSLAFVEERIMQSMLHIGCENKQHQVWFTSVDKFPVSSRSIFRLDMR